MTEPSIAPITTGLKDALTSGVGVAIGSGQKPAGARPPYGFLTRISTVWTGTLAEPWREAQLVYQLQCIALDADVVELLENKAAAVFASWAGADGWDLVRVAPLGSPGVRVDTNEHPEAPLFYSTPQWSIWAQPSA